METFVGRFTTSDVDTADTHTYALVAGEGDADNDSFSIRGDSLLTEVLFDYETQSNLNIRVRTTDDGEGNLQFEKSFTIKVIDKDETGIGATRTSGFKMYPNPSDNSVTIEFSNPDQYPYDLTISDLSGKRMLQIRNIRNESFILEEGTLEKGYYIVRLEGKAVFRSSLIIE